MRKELRTKNNSLRLQQHCRSEVSPDRGRAREVKLKRSALYKDRHQPSICPLILASTVSSSAACAAMALSGPVYTGQGSRRRGRRSDRGRLQLARIARPREEESFVGCWLNRPRLPLLALTCCYSSCFPFRRAALNKQASGPLFTAGDRKNKREQILWSLGKYFAPKYLSSVPEVPVASWIELSLSESSVHGGALVDLF